MRVARELVDEGACVVAVLHDLNLAAAHSDRVVVLSDGRLVADGEPWDVLTEEMIQEVYRQEVKILNHPTRRRPVVVTT